jgi:hypothetical protein
MKTKGVSELIFEIQDKEFLNKFGIKKQTKFHSHKELDEFVHLLLKVDLDFESKYKSEYELLKGFDRAFWLRHYANNQNEIYLPLNFERKEEEGTTVCDCPFSNPSDTGSIFFQ